MEDLDVLYLVVLLTYHISRAFYIIFWVKKKFFPYICGFTCLSFLGHFASVGSKDPEMSQTVGHFVIFKEKAEVTQKCCICGSSF